MRSVRPWRFRVVHRLGLAVVVVVAATVVGAVPAQASAPAGMILDIDSIGRVNPITISWSGTYSCTGPEGVSMPVVASDGINSAATTRALTCPATGAAVSGLLTTPSGAPWGSLVEIGAALKYASGTTLLAASKEEFNGSAEGVLTLDSGMLSGGSAVFSGQYSCDASGATTNLIVGATQ